MTTTTLDPALRPYRTRIGYDELQQAVQNVIDIYNRDAAKLRKYGHPREAGMIDQEIVHIKELLKGDFFEYLGGQIDQLMKETPMTAEKRS
jgi:hypothetical protein